MLNFFILGMIMVFSSAASAQGLEAFVCITEQTVGFQYNKTTEEYESTVFHNRKMFAIKRAIPGPESYQFPAAKWVVTTLGGKMVEYSCAEEINEGGFLICGDVWRSFKLNEYNLRFIETSPSGYTTRWDIIEAIKEEKIEEDKKKGIFHLSRAEGDHPPYMAIGTCTKF